MGTLWGDLRAAVRTMVLVRWLLPVALAVGVVSGATSLVPAGLPVLGVVVSLAWYVVTLGWIGVEYVVMAQRTRGVRLDRSDVVRAVVRLAPPMVRLELLLFPLWVALIVATIVLGATVDGNRIVMFFVEFASLLVWAFAGPGIALTTLRVRSALSIAWRLVRGSWADTWAHVLVLSAALAGLWTAAAAWHPFIGIFVGTVGGLLVRGVTTLRYIQLVEVSWDQIPGTAAVSETPRHP